MFFTTKTYNEVFILFEVQIIDSLFEHTRQSILLGLDVFIHVRSDQVKKIQNKPKMI